MELGGISNELLSFQGQNKDRRFEENVIPK
jgi:hypothetical protein